MNGEVLWYRIQTYSSRIITIAYWQSQCKSFAEPYPSVPDYPTGPPLTSSAPGDSRQILFDAPDCPEVILYNSCSWRLQTHPRRRSTLASRSGLSGSDPLPLPRGFYSSVYSTLTVIVNSLSEEDNGTVSSARFCRAPFTPGRYLLVL